MGRKHWIDVLRGMAMLLVVMGHCIGFADNPINRMVLCFHMALFYFVSGLTFYPSKYGCLRNGLKVKSLGIILQYICFSIMGILLYYILAYFGLNRDESPVSLLNSFIGVFFPDGNNGTLVTSGFWFVYDIIVIDLLCITIFYSYKQRRFWWCVFPLIYMVCMSFSNHNIIFRQVVGLFFFILGKLTNSFMLQNNYICNKSTKMIKCVGGVKSHF